MRKNKLVWLICLILLPYLMSGCFAWKIVTKKKVKKEVPKILVLPFPCENSGIGDQITQGLISGLTKKLDRLDVQNFQSLLSSRSIRIEDLMIVSENMAQYEKNEGDLLADPQSDQTAQKPEETLPGIPAPATQTMSPPLATVSTASLVSEQFIKGLFVQRFF